MCGHRCIGDEMEEISLVVDQSEDRAHKSLSNDVICSVKAFCEPGGDHCL